MMDLLRDDFEIHGPANIHTESINKEALLQMLDKVKSKLEEKHPQKHDFYPVIMALLQSVDSTVTSVH
jgi:hypothetical protein